MSVADWIVAVIGVALWIWLLRQIVNPNGYFDRVCLGCQRHFVIPGCPTHDPQQRRTPPAVNGDALSATSSAESSVG